MASEIAAELCAQEKKNVCDLCYRVVFGICIDIFQLNELPFYFSKQFEFLEI